MRRGDYRGTRPWAQAHNTRHLREAEPVRRLVDAALVVGFVSPSGFAQRVGSLKQRLTGQSRASSGGTGVRPSTSGTGYVNSEPGQDQPLLYYYRELGNATS